MVVRGGGGGGGQVIRLRDDSLGLCINSNRRWGWGGWEGSRTASLHHRQGVSKGASAEMKQSWKSRKQWRKGGGGHE